MHRYSEKPESGGLIMQRKGRVARNKEEMVAKEKDN